MGYFEAKEDGIKIVKSGSMMQDNNYVVECSYCGNELITNRYTRGKSYRCKKCIENENDVIRNVKRNRMFNSAKKEILKIFLFGEGNKIREMYDNAFKKVKCDIDNGCRFDSKEEVMVAIELTRSNIPYEHHKKLCGYELDFYLPDEKINLEIDGVLYHRDNVDKDFERDEKLKSKQDDDFITVRILDVSIDRSVYRLMDKVHMALNERSSYMIGNYITDDSYNILSYIFDK